MADAATPAADPSRPLGSLDDVPGLPERVFRVNAFLGSPDLDCAPVIGTDYKAIVLDLSAGSRDLGEPLAGLSVARFSALVEQAMRRAGTGYAFGRWGERRELYDNELFAGTDAAAGERRSIHMGVDVFCTAGTPVHAPLPGRVHLRTINEGELDYGPLLILEHAAPDGTPLYTLYGHLDRAGSEHLSTGDAVAAGDRIAAVGAPPDNGNWPPHLHFQVIADLLDMGAGFPGVAYPREQHAWLALSPLPAPFFPQVSPRRLDGRELPAAETA